MNQPAISRNITALIALIEHRSARRFRWRRGHDCVSFAAACVAAQTGEDLLADLPKWRNQAEAEAAIAAQGGLIAALDARLPRIAPALAQRGDIAGLPDNSAIGIRLMVVEGATLVGPGARGLERLPRSQMANAWSVTGSAGLEPGDG